MFLYCSNNPINRVDSNGYHWYFLWIDDLLDWIFDDNVGDDYENTSHEIEDLPDYLKQDEDNEKSEEEKILDADLFAVYNGTPVVKLPIGQNAFSFGIMFIGNDVSQEWVVKHEYGHKKQFDELGIVKYLIFVALPSLKCYYSNADNYYSYPWEYGANQFGGVTESDCGERYLNGTSDLYELYWKFAKDF